MFDEADLELLDKTDEVNIETTRRTTIWIVRIGPDVYVRSVRGPAGKWFQAIRDGATATLHAGDRSWRVTGSLAPEAIEPVSDAIRKKYLARWKGPTESMLVPNTLETTLRLKRA
jgi:hypothetical protein